MFVRRKCGVIESEKLKYVIAKGNYDSALRRVKILIRRYLRGAGA